MHLIPRSGRSLGEGNGNPLQYSCLGNLIDRGAWWARVHGVAKSRTRLSEWTMATKSVGVNFQAFSAEVVSWGGQVSREGAAVLATILSPGSLGSYNPGCLSSDNLLKLTTRLPSNIHNVPGTVLCLLPSRSVSKQPSECKWTQGRSSKARRCILVAQTPGGR